MAKIDLGGKLKIELSDLVMQEAERIGVSLSAISSEGKTELSGPNKAYSIELSARFNDEDYAKLKDIADRMLNPISEKPASETTVRPYGIPWERLCLSIKHQDTLIGFATNILYDFEDNRVNYFSGVAISPEHQGRGIYGFAQRIWSAPDSDILVTRTMNPKVAGSFNRIKEGYLAFPSGSEAPELVKRLLSNLFF